MLRLSQSQNLLDFLLHSALGVVAIITISIVLGMLLTFEEKLLTYLTIKKNSLLCQEHNNVTVVFLT